MYIVAKHTTLAAPTAVLSRLHLPTIDLTCFTSNDNEIVVETINRDSVRVLVDMTGHDYTELNINRGQCESTGKHVLEVNCIHGDRMVGVRTYRHLRMLIDQSEPYVSNPGQPRSPLPISAWMCNNLEYCTLLPSGDTVANLVEMMNSMYYEPTLNALSLVAHNPSTFRGTQLVSTDTILRVLERFGTCPSITLCVCRIIRALPIDCRSMVVTSLSLRNNNHNALVHRRVSELLLSVK
jgi:hypothetical protein